MGIEIERKFLVSCDTWRTGSPGIAYRQGYLCEATGCCVRIRTLGLQEAWLTVKGHVSTATRLEVSVQPPHYINKKNISNPLPSRSII